MVMGVGVTERNIFHIMVEHSRLVTIDFSLITLAIIGTTAGLMEAGNTSTSTALLKPKTYELYS